MITFLHWHKYLTPPATPTKLLADATSWCPPHLKNQWWQSWSVACYRQSSLPPLVLSRPAHSLWPIRPAQPVLASQFLPYGQAPQRPNFSKRFYDPSATPQDRDKYNEDQPDLASATISPFAPNFYRPCPSHLVLIKGHPRTISPIPSTFTDDSPSSDSSPTLYSSTSRQFPFSILLHIMLPYLYWLEMSPFPRTIFGPLIRKPPRAITWGNLQVLGRATLSPYSLLMGIFPSWLLLVIAFYLSSLTKACLKAYSCTVIHPTFPCKYVFVYFLFHHCLLVEGSHFFTLYWW